MLMKQYTYHYGLYDDLIKTKKESVSLGVAKAPPSDRKSTYLPSESVGSHRVLIQQSQIQSLFQ
jgi:hypothetical protein